MAAPTARLLEAAATQQGLFTTAQAEAVNVRAEQVRRMVAHGDLEHRAYGVYRIPTVPFDVTPAVAIRQAIELGVPGDLIRQAIRRATAREYIGEQTAATLLDRLHARSLGVR